MKTEHQKKKQNESRLRESFFISFANENCKIIKLTVHLLTSGASKNRDCAINGTYLLDNIQDFLIA